MAEPDDRVLLTTEEVARLLRVHPKHVYRLLHRGLPGRRVGSEWRFARDEVMQWAQRSPGAGLPMAARGPAVTVATLVPPLIAANGDVVIEVLLRLLQGQHDDLIGFVQADRQQAITWLEQNAVLAAGCHAGGFPTRVGDERVARIHLVTREIGLVGRAGRSVPSLPRLGRVRFASRPPSAGVRHHLDAALRRDGLSPAQVHKSALIFSSHLDVACAVAAGRVDVGLASRAWGARLGLEFRLLAQEPYGLIVRARDLGDPRIVRLCEVAQSESFRTEVGAIPGYDVNGAGDIKYDA